MPGWNNAPGIPDSLEFIYCSTAGDYALIAEQFFSSNHRMMFNVSPISCNCVALPFHISSALAANVFVVDDVALFCEDFLSKAF